MVERSRCRQINILLYIEGRVDFAYIEGKVDFGRGRGVGDGMRSRCMV